MPLKRGKEKLGQPVDTFGSTTVVYDPSQPSEGGSIDQSWLNGPIGIFNGMLFGLCLWAITLTIAYQFI